MHGGDVKQAHLRQGAVGNVGEQGFLALFGHALAGLQGSGRRDGRPRRADGEGIGQGRAWRLVGIEGRKIVQRGFVPGGKGGKSVALRRGFAGLARGARLHGFNRPGGVAQDGAFSGRGGSGRSGRGGGKFNDLRLHAPRGGRLRGRGRRVGGGGNVGGLVQIVPLAGGAVAHVAVLQPGKVGAKGAAQGADQRTHPLGHAAP